MLIEHKIYIVRNLNDARRHLSQVDGKLLLTNPKGSSRYYGVRVIDYFFKKLREEFPDKIEDIIIDVHDDYASFVTANSLGYRKISYNKFGN